MTATTDDGIPRTDICESCDREIVPELGSVSGQHAMIHAARTAGEGYTRISESSAEIRWSCACSGVTMESNGVSEFDVSDDWMWEDEL